MAWFRFRKEREWRIIGKEVHHQWTSWVDKSERAPSVKMFALHSPASALVSMLTSEHPPSTEQPSGLNDLLCQW